MATDRNSGKMGHRNGLRYLLISCSIAPKGQSSQPLRREPLDVFEPAGLVERPSRLAIFRLGLLTPN
jgi:hypothetical protein